MGEALAVFATGISTVAAVVGVVFAWPAFAEWRNRQRVPNSLVEASTLERVQELNTLRVGCIPFPPLISCPSGGGGSATGLYRDIFDEIAAQTGLDIEYIPLRNDIAMDYLVTEKVDVVACLLETPQRAAKATFTARIHQMAICGVVRRDSAKISSQADLRRPEIEAIVAEGEIGAEVARRHFGMTPDNGRLHEIVTKEVPAIFGPVLSRHADVAITDGVTCADYLASDAEASELLALRFTSDPLWLVPCGLMVRQDDEAFASFLEDHVRGALLQAPIATHNERLAERYKDLLRPM